jgi:predicted RNase H-like nuclease (RuvC/YqgF family)
VTLEEIIIEESHNLSFPHGRNLRSIAFHVRKLEDWAKQLENENDTFKKRIKRLEEMYEGEIGENEQFLGSNLQGLLIRELNWSKERIKRLESAGDALEYTSVISEAGEDPNGFEKLLIAQREWRKAKEAKP